MRIFLAILMLVPMAVHSQTSKDYAVLLTAEVNENLKEIKIKWPSFSAGSYFVYKKLKSEVVFPSTFELLPGSATEFVDTAVEIGESYEYYVQRNSSPPGLGYINARIKTETEANGTGVKGRLILLIDSSIYDTLDLEIDRLVEDLEGECWTVLKHNVPSSFDVPDVKQIIVDDYQADPQHTSAVFILGHVAVPYSGNIVPDGHSNHVGAWPADCYYGELNGTWTDNQVNNTSASDPRTINVPGDGKFDQSTIPSNLELQVGRVDLSNMPAFSKSEIELMRAYLNKNHAFRIKELEAVPRALIDDNFGGFSGEAFAASGWKAFSTFFGPDSIYTNVGSSLDYRTDLNNRSYLWSYGCGGGSYTSAGGIGNTTNLAGDSLQSIFTLLFGSYFGDWDKQNNFLRAPLAQGWTLTNAWSGRPHWYFHHMGLGENIGYSFLKSINNANSYSQSFKKYVHIALMGDPTLTMFIVAPPSDLLLSEVENHVDLFWAASPDQVEGYHVYRKDSLHGPYKRVNEDIVTGTTFTDTDFNSNGNFYYSVRAVKLEVRPSGSFYNLSGGATGHIETIYTQLPELSRNEKISVFPNPGRAHFTITYDDLEADYYSFTVQNLQGQIMDQSVLRLEGSGSIERSISNLNQGAYIFIIQNQNKRLTEKVLVY